MRDVRIDVLAERDLAWKVRDAERLLSEDAKEALDLVQPRRARRRVVEVLLVGVALGLAAAAASTRALRSLLFGVGALDAGTFAGVAGAMAVVGLIAAWLPARRASRVDPMESIRGE